MNTFVDLIIIVIASVDELYNKIIDIYWKPLIKYIELNKIDIKIIFVYNKYHENINLDEKYILCFDDEDIIVPGNLKKTIKAFTEIKKKYIYNYILRTNISSFLIIDKLLKFKESLTPNKLYSGFLGKYNYDGSDLYFVSGTGIWFSPDMIDIIINNKDEFNYDLIDDVSFGLYFKSYHKEHFDRFDIIDDIQINYINEILHYIYFSNHYHIRIKHSSDRINKDLLYFKRLTDIFYNSNSNMIE